MLLRAVHGDLAASTAMFVRVERAARRAGFAAVLDAWGEPSLARMRQGDD